MLGGLVAGNSWSAGWSHMSKKNAVLINKCCRQVSELSYNFGDRLKTNVLDLVGQDNSRFVNLGGQDT
jgi:hypothetical protein